MVLAIYVANAFGSVFLFGSCINYLCLLNIYFVYNSMFKEEIFYAIRDIMVGEELIIMYINGTNCTRD